MKSYIKEVIIILIFSVLLALVYNYNQPKPLPLLYAKKELGVYDDKLLFDKAKESDNLKQDDKTVSYDQMLKILENENDFIIVDARNHDDWSKSHIGNSINIFPYEEEAVMMNKILDLPQDKKIIVYCDGGNCDSSHKIAEIMNNFGYIDVFIYSGGWDEWSKKRGIQ